MTEERKPARDRYDALVDFVPTKAIPKFIVGLAKVVYEQKGGRWALAAAEPLEGDIRSKPKNAAQILGSDFKFHKAGTDVVVLGDAIAPGGKPVESMLVNFACGPLRKTVRVVGDRTATATHASDVSFSTPAPFEKMPMTLDRTYGGVDMHAPGSSPEYDYLVIDGGLGDHPGVYPRNPIGRGYYVVPAERAEPMMLPNLEDPSQPVRPDTFFVLDPAEWWKQPLSWSMDWTYPGLFPRMLYLDAEPWFPVPIDERLHEVRRGYLLPNLPQKLAQNPELMRLFYQEASHGMILPDAVAGTQGVITGMSEDEPEFRFEVPPTPRIDITLDGKKTRVQPKMTSLVLRPNEKKMTASFAAVLTDMPRTFIPGIFRDIPLSISVDGDTPVPYETPQTVADMVAQAKQG